MKKILILVVLIFILFQIYPADFNKTLLETMKGELIIQIGYKNCSEQFINNYIDTLFKIAEVTETYIIVEAINKKTNETYAKHYILIDQIRDIKIYTKKS